MMPIFVYKTRKGYKDWDKYTIQSLPAMLNCDAKTAKKIYLKGLYQQAKFHLAYSFFFGKYGQSLFADELQKVQIKNPNPIVQASEAVRPVIFLSIHMGVYYMGFLKLANKFRTERTVNIVKITKASEREASFSKKIRETCPNVEFIRFDYRTGERIYSQLKSNNAVAMMMDRETRVEGRTTVNLLGRQCHIQNGPAKLAVATKAMVIPVVNYIDNQGCNIIQVAQSINGKREPNETAATAVDRVMTELASHMEKWLTAHPEQMHCWPCIMSTINMKKTDKVKQTFRYP
jgi:lauroyl/myristoyl acyltransferase